jgi:hypothetical protein
VREPQRALALLTPFQIELKLTFFFDSAFRMPYQDLYLDQLLISFEVPRQEML